MKPISPEYKIKQRFVKKLSLLKEEKESNMRFEGWFMRHIGNGYGNGNVREKILTESAQERINRSYEFLHNQHEDYLIFLDNSMLLYSNLLDTFKQIDKHVKKIPISKRDIAASILYTNAIKKFNVNIGRLSLQKSENLSDNNAKEK
ncbi:MAG: hypothetical protein ACYCS1_04245 [Gammaproteobacteria bacterium]